MAVYRGHTLPETPHPAGDAAARNARAATSHVAVMPAPLHELQYDG